MSHYPTIGLPSGIGDFSWAYSKLKHLGLVHYEIADGEPYRTVPFVERLPWTASAKYGEFRYDDIIQYEQATRIPTIGARWSDVEELVKGGGRVLIQPNKHLERGRRLEEWMPELPTDFHYDITTTPFDVTMAEKALVDLKKPVFGISCASYRGAEAWKTWGYPEWSEFLRMFQAEVGGTMLLLGGFWDDLTYTLASEGYPDMVGKTHIATAVEILKRLDGYIGFSSGLGVIGTVLRRPVFMMWPDFQKPLSESWASPETLETRQYVASPWREPSTVFQLAKNWLRANYG